MTNLSNITITKEATQLSIMDGAFKMLLSEIVTSDIDYVEVDSTRRFNINSHSALSMINLGIELFALLEDNITYRIVSDYKGQIRILPTPVESENYKKLVAMFK